MIFKGIIAAIAIAAGGVAFAGPIATTNLVQNGSFEKPGVTSGNWQIFQTIPGWTAGPLGVELRNSIEGVAQDGFNYAELDTTGNSFIAQDLLGTGALVTGWVTLEFWYSSRPNTQWNTNGLSFGFGNQMQSISATTNPTSSHQWKKYTGEFYLTNSDRLKFEATGKGDSLGMSIDNISVKQHQVNRVPEPAGFALVGVALAAAGFAKWRKADKPK